MFCRVASGRRSGASAGSRARGPPRTCRAAVRPHRHEAARLGRAPVELPAVRGKQPRPADRVAVPSSRSTTSTLRRDPGPRADRAAADEEEGLGPLALAEQVLVGVERGRCVRSPRSAAGARLEPVEHGRLGDQLVNRLHDVPSSLGADRRRLLGDVDADRAPRDAAAAANAAGAAELVEPAWRACGSSTAGSATSCRGAHGAAVHVGVVDREARIPALVALDVSPSGRSMSSIVVQKHVGQTIVQLPQVRQRSATSSQRGCSMLRYRSSLIRRCRASRPICAAARAGTARAAATRFARGLSRPRAARRRPRAVPTPRRSNARRRRAPRSAACRNRP